MEKNYKMSNFIEHDETLYRCKEKTDTFDEVIGKLNKGENVKIDIEFSEFWQVLDFISIITSIRPLGKCTICYNGDEFIF